MFWHTLLPKRIGRELHRVAVRAPCPNKSRIRLPGETLMAGREGVTKLEAYDPYAASVASSIGSMIDGSSFSGLLTRVEIGHIRIKSAGNGRIKSRGSGSSPSQRV